MKPVGKGDSLKRKSSVIGAHRQFRFIAGIFFVLICMGYVSVITAQGQNTESVIISVTPHEDQRGALITWQPVNGAVSYEVQRGDKEDEEPVTIASVDSTYFEYTDVDIQRGRYYYYRVGAFLGDGTCYYSEITAFGCSIRPVSHVKLARSSNSSAEITWNKRKKAVYYRVYCAQGREENYQCIGITKKSSYRVKKLKPDQTYYYKIRACVKKKESVLDSGDSAIVWMKTRPRHFTTVFAGDSIMTGMKSYHSVEKINIGGRKELVAAIGLNTTTFRTRRVFGGKSGLQKVVSYKPYRVYMLLGINEIHYRPSKDVIAQYKSMIKTIQAESPKTDIVLLPLAPVTEAEQQRRTGFRQIPGYNKGLKNLADSMGLKYYDYTDFLKDSHGYLSRQYATADGVHWNAAAYDIFAKKIETYDQTLE